MSALKFMTIYHDDWSASMKFSLYKDTAGGDEALETLEGVKPLYFGSWTNKKSSEIIYPY